MAVWTRWGVLAAAALCAQAARAGETLMELTHRGLDLRALEASGVAVEAMDVSIGMTDSTIRYRLVNATGAPVSARLVFPLPDVDFSDAESLYAIPASSPDNWIGLIGRADQKPLKLVVTPTAAIDGKDVAGALRRAGLPAAAAGGFQNRLAAMPPQTRRRLADEGLIAETGASASGEPLYAPRWTLRGEATGALDMAPGATVALEFRFRTSVGVSLDSVLREPLRSEKNLSREVDRRRADYCVDRAFFGGLDKIVSAAAARRAAAQAADDPRPAAIADPFAEPSGSPPPAEPRLEKPAGPQPRTFPEANVANLRERRIDFDLGAGAPDAPVKEFRLTVDKGKPDRIVSFCSDNLKKTSATGFQMRAADHRPSGRLKILLVGPGG